VTGGEGAGPAGIRREQSGGGAGGIRPEQALEAARIAAERKRAAGAYPGDTVADPGRPAGPDLARLREWAIVEVDPELLYSTRKRGAPITWLKRMLLRLMRQYTTELEAQQTRFNVGVVAYLENLEKHDSE
jgi:hypothetical protein